ncbi:MAG: Aminotransferase, class [Myxococcaceae bacterium]|nr:Aminotransferase, class [Myxococcaceae bacterium]
MPGFLESFVSWANERVAQAETFESIDALPGQGELELGGRRVLNADSTDLLGLSADPRVKEAAQAATRKFGAQGTWRMKPLHELEERLAAFTGREAAVVTPGFEAALFPVVEGADQVLTDARSDFAEREFLHAIAPRSARFRDTEDLEALLVAEPETPTLIAAGAVHPYEGDLAALPRIAELAAKANAGLVVDESLSLGLLGSSGAGAVEHFGLSDQVTLVLTSLGGALGSRGWMIAGPRAVIDFVRDHLDENACISPPAAAAALKALEIVQSEPQRRVRAWELAQRLHTGLRSLGFDTGPSVTARVPVWIGDEVRCERLARVLLETGARVRAVPLRGRARLLLTLQATHTDAQVDQLLELLEKHGRRIGVLDGPRRVDAEVVQLARPGTFITRNLCGAHWDEAPAAPAPSETQSVLSNLAQLPSRAMAGNFFDTVERLTWRAANLGAGDLRKLWQRRKSLRGLFQR